MLPVAEHQPSGPPPEERNSHNASIASMIVSAQGIYRPWAKGARTGLCVFAYVWVRSSVRARSSC